MRIFILAWLMAFPPALMAEVFFYHTDNVGTPVAMTDRTGAVVWRANDLPFGEQHTIQGTGQNNRRLAGKEMDESTGLVSMGVRYMDPETGMFLQPDPVGPVDVASGKINLALLTSPERLNRYSYALNNPYRYIDPDDNHPTSILKCHYNEHHDPENAERDWEYRKENAVAGAIIVTGLIGVASAPAAAGISNLASKIAPLSPAAIKIGETTQRNWKHISKHLPEFQRLDPKMTLKSVEKLGRRIASNSNNFVSSKGGNSNFDQVVTFGKENVTVRAVLNVNNTLRSVHIRR